MLSGAVAGTAYYKRKDLGLGYQWATDHMKYVGTLWNEDVLKKRMDRVIEIEQTLGVPFRTCVIFFLRIFEHGILRMYVMSCSRFYTLLPPKPAQYPDSRTFIILPLPNSKLRPYFTPTQNSVAEDEVEAHTGMFEASTNDGYYELGLATARIIREAIMNGRGMVQDEAMARNANEKAGESIKQDMETTLTEERREANIDTTTQGNPRQEGNLVDL